MADASQLRDNSTTLAAPLTSDGGSSLTDYPTPIPISRRTRNVTILGIVVALILIVRAAPVVLTISLAGAFVALILSFPVRWLSLIVPRWLAIVLAFLSLLVLLVVILLVIVPVMINQLTDLIDAIPALADEAEALLRDLLAPLQARGLLTEDTDEVIADIRNGFMGRASQVAQDILAWLLGAVTSILDLAITAFGIIFVAVYLLIDIDRIRNAYLALWPASYRADALDLWSRFSYSLSRYLGGLAISLSIQGALSAFALSALDVPYALLLGVWVSVTAIIPYLGAFLGAIPAVALAFLQSPTTGVLAILLYVAIQQVESNVLTPRIQGQAVRVHPILILLGVLAASEIGGLRGAVFAVPTLAVIRVLVDFLAARIRVQPS